MGLEEVEADIRKRIEAQVSSILAEAEKDAEQIISKGKGQVSGLKKTREEEISKISSEHRNREIAQARMNARKEILDAKKEAIENLFARIEEKLTGLSAADKKEILTALVEKAKHNLADAKHVYSNKEDKKEVSAIASKHGLAYAGTIGCRGGLVVENKDKEVRLDFTYETLLADFRKEAMKELATQLFGGKQ